MNFLFWNVRGNNIDSELVALVANLNVDVLALAEYSGNPKSLLRGFDSAGLNFFSLPNVACERIRIFSSISPALSQIRQESTHYTIREFVRTGHLPLLVMFAHLPSKKNATESDQASYASVVRAELEAIEESVGHNNTIIVGDLNMNPFEKGLISAASFNAVSCLRTISRGSRVIKNTTYKFFYNPMWNLMGDHNGTPGSYFYNPQGYDSIYWHLFDQVLVRPGIAHRLDPTSLRLVTSNGATNYLSPSGRPEFSDHLPLFFSFDSKPQRSAA